uniref:Uncharacterized protein n=1 Tax=Mycena chlorophos TaxID=658473 RepID=A0ABQ0M8Z0_MYCCL|nr:predicted protein [Mycena chlorophos]
MKDRGAGIFACHKHAGIIQYVLFAILLVCAGVIFVRPLGPRAYLDEIERIIRAIKDALDKAREEHILNDRKFALEIQLQLTQAQERMSFLRLKLLRHYGPTRSTREYFQIFGELSSEVRAFRRDVQRTQLLLLTQIEEGKRGRHVEEANELRALSQASNSSVGQPTMF